MLLDKLIAAGLFLFLSIFPGVFVIKKLSGISTPGKQVLCISLSLSFWMLFVWFAHLVHLPVSPGYLILLGLFVLLFVYQHLPVIKTRSVALVYVSIKQLKGSQILLISALIYLFIPYFIMTIPPGNDISMHGYITRLIINNNGLPSTYDPILPDSPFGSYSAGYQVLTALIAGMDPVFLREAINLMSITVYLHLLLAIIFFYNFFLTEKISIYAGIITLFIGNSVITTIGWGGNPTILSLAYCFVFYAAVLVAVRQQNRLLFLISSFLIAAIPMTHAIPAVVFVYSCAPFLVLLIWQNRSNLKWLLINGVLTSLISVVLLFPFVLGFQNDTSPELTKMIREWQNSMMGNTLNEHLGHNILAVLKQINYRSGDPLMITFGVACISSLLFKSTRKRVLIVLVFLTYLYVLVFNSAYWFLPLSEILYPERVVYFMIILMGLIIGIFFEGAAAEDLPERFKKILLPALIGALVTLGTIKTFYGFLLSVTLNNKVACDPQVMDAFQWIEASTPPDAVLKCTYADAGIWIPAFSNRATIGAHIHFIHEVSNVNQVLETSGRPQYYFVTRKDLEEKTPVLVLIRDKDPVFNNGAVVIYH